MIPKRLHARTAFEAGLVPDQFTFQTAPTVTRDYQDKDSTEAVWTVVATTAASFASSLLLNRWPFPIDPWRRKADSNRCRSRDLPASNRTQLLAGSVLQAKQLAINPPAPKVRPGRPSPGMGIKMRHPRGRQGPQEPICFSNRSHLVLRLSQHTAAYIETACLEANPVGVVGIEPTNAWSQTRWPTLSPHPVSVANANAPCNNRAKFQSGTRGEPLFEGGLPLPTSCDSLVKGLADCSRPSWN